MAEYLPRMQAASRERAGACSSPARRSSTRPIAPPRFLAFLEQLTGIHGLLPDDSLMGGGLHQSGDGGFLNIHADFTGHPHQERWRRRINLLIYLNPTWQESMPDWNVPPRGGLCQPHSKPE